MPSARQECKRCSNLTAVRDDQGVCLVCQSQPTTEENR